MKLKSVNHTEQVFLSKTPFYECCNFWKGCLLTYSDFYLSSSIYGDPTRSPASWQNQHFFHQTKFRRNNFFPIPPPEFRNLDGVRIPKPYQISNQTGNKKKSLRRVLNQYCRLFFSTIPGTESVPIQYPQWYWFSTHSVPINPQYSPYFRHIIKFSDRHKHGRIF